MSVYDKVPVAKIGRSRHNLSYTKKLTGKLGYLIPTLCDELVAGDIAKIGNVASVEFLPLAGPVMDTIFMKTYYFFTPYRIIDGNFENIFMKRILDSSTGKYRELKDSDNVTVPHWVNGSELTHDFVKNSLADYALGLVCNDVPANDCPVDYPRRAYNLIFNEWFRDEKLDSEVDLTNESLLRRRWSKDYFTSAFESAQFGDPVALPLSGFAPITDYLKQVGSGVAEYLCPRTENIGTLSEPLNGSTTTGTFEHMGNTVILANQDTTSFNISTNPSHAMGFGSQTYFGNNSSGFYSPTEYRHVTNSNNDVFPVHWTDSNGNYMTRGSYDAGSDSFRMFIGNNFPGSSSDSSSTNPYGKTCTDRAFANAFGGGLNGYLGFFGVNSEEMTKSGNRLTYTTHLYENRTLPRQLVADLSTAGTFDINDLRLANALQRWKEKVNVTGLRYVEYLQAQYGVFLRDDRAQRPIYLGSTSSTLYSTSVIQTDPDPNGESPAGTRTGTIVGRHTGSIPTFHAKEHGVIMGITVLYPEHNYMNGLHKQWIKNDFYDFFNPMFECVGDEEILEKELYISSSEAQNNIIFGFQGRNNHMRSRQNMICGDMRDILLYRTFTDTFENAPNLSSEFIECIPSNRPFAYQDDSSPHFIMEFGNIFKVVRPIDSMPFYHL